MLLLTQLLCKTRSSQDAVSEDHPGALSFPGKTVQYRLMQSLVMLDLEQAQIL
jgi:hypothetical protein